MLSLSCRALLPSTSLRATVHPFVPISIARSFSSMFCMQCEQTDKGTGCTTLGICGKTPETAALQDLLLGNLRGIGIFASRIPVNGKSRASIPALRQADEFVLRALFSTLTNVNFDSVRMMEYISEANEIRDSLRTTYEDIAGSAAVREISNDAAKWKLPKNATIDDLVEEGLHKFGVLKRREMFGEDISGIQELITYGLKGLCAYAEHAFLLGQESDDVFAFVHETLNFLESDSASDVQALLGQALKVGEVNLKVMSLLDKGHTDRFGHPTPTEVLLTPKEGKCILVSGHDMTFLEEVLKQTDGTGVHVYTHGELLPAHAYPGLKSKYPHLIGNYGGAWQMQKFDFTKFPGPIVMTTNCLIEPRKQYKDNIYTVGVTGWPGVEHLRKLDFKKVIAQAKEMPGFPQTIQPEKTTLIGFARNTVLSAAPQIIDLIQNKSISDFYVIGGCDGSEGERNYFRELALKLPQTAVILTLGCGKFRINNLSLGNIPNSSLPRLLDMGQCNDAYSAIQVALALSDALKTDVNSLPIHYAISWFEQKAVAVFLTMLHLGLQNIHLGPNLPAFVTPNVLSVLVDKFKIAPITTPEKDFNL